jgi:hypothetical protein
MHQALRAAAGPEPGSAFAGALAAAAPTAPAPADQASEAVRPALILLLAKVGRPAPSALRTLLAHGCPWSSAPGAVPLEQRPWAERAG